MQTEQRRTRQQILNDPQLSAYEKGQLLRLLPDEGSQPWPAIPAEVADELRQSAKSVADAAGTVLEFDRMHGDHRQLLEASQAEIKRLAFPASAPTDDEIREFLLLRGRVELLNNFLQRSLSQRAALLAALRECIAQLVARLKQLTGRTLPRWFESPNCGIESVGAAAAAECERVIEGRADEFETIQRDNRLRDVSLFCS